MTFLNPMAPQMCISFSCSSSLYPFQCSRVARQSPRPLPWEWVSAPYILCPWKVPHFSLGPDSHSCNSDWTDALKLMSRQGPWYSISRQKYLRTKAIGPQSFPRNSYSTVFIDITYYSRKLLLRKMKTANNFIGYSRNFLKDPSTLQQKASKDNLHPKTLWNPDLKIFPLLHPPILNYNLGFVPSFNKASSLSSTLKTHLN